MNLEQLFNTYKEKSITGRYITLTEIEPILKKLNTNNELKIIGYSVLNKPIYSYTIGSGTQRIYLWSQMHGNESTTTKALFDFLNMLKDNTPFAKQLLKTFTFCSIPMLNPDGAALYTRENANKVDLNRDSKNLTQPESKILRAVFEDFKPHYCFNLHDQRTIFGVGNTGKPATVSFLAPSYNEARDVNETRQKAINLIVEINNVLQNFIPGQVGRFDDSFNINCIGDTFQFLGVPTILFEAGHFPNDYEREITRKYIFISLLSGFKVLAENDITQKKTSEYLSISQNNQIFYDFLFKKVKINYDSKEIITNFALQFKEELIENKVHFVAYVSKIGALDNYYAHQEYDANFALYNDERENFPQLNEKAHFKLNNVFIFENGFLKSK